MNVKNNLQTVSVEKFIDTFGSSSNPNKILDRAFRNKRSDVFLFIMKQSPKDLQEWVLYQAFSLKNLEAITLVLQTPYQYNLSGLLNHYNEFKDFVIESPLKEYLEMTHFKLLTYTKEGHHNSKIVNVVLDKHLIGDISDIILEYMFNPSQFFSLLMHLKQKYTYVVNKTKYSDILKAFYEEFCTGNCGIIENDLFELLCLFKKDHSNLVFRHVFIPLILTGKSEWFSLVNYTEKCLDPEDINIIFEHLSFDCYMKSSIKDVILQNIVNYLKKYGFHFVDLTADNFIFSSSYLKEIYLHSPFFETHKELFAYGVLETQDVLKWLNTVSSQRSMESILELAETRDLIKLIPYDERVEFFLGRASIKAIETTKMSARMLRISAVAWSLIKHTFGREDGEHYFVEELLPLLSGCHLDSLEEMKKDQETHTKALNKFLENDKSNVAYEQLSVGSKCEFKMMDTSEEDCYTKGLLCHLQTTVVDKFENGEDKEKVITVKVDDIFINTYEDLVIGITFNITYEEGNSEEYLRASLLGEGEIFYEDNYVAKLYLR